MKYLICCQINSLSNYEKISNTVKVISNGNWCEYLHCVWLVKTNYKSANELYDQFKPFININDKLLIVEIKNNKQGMLKATEWNYINTAIFKDD